MTTIDQLLLNLVNNNLELVKKLVPSRDHKVLSSLAKIIVSPTYITENQSRLILKILGQYQSQLSKIVEDISTSLDNPSWAKTFREPDKTKKLYIATLPDSLPMLAVEFAFSANLRAVMQSLNKSVSNLTQTPNGRIYYADLTEHNIVTLVDALEKHEFEIEEKLKNYCETIKSWSEEEIKDQFLLTNIVHPNFQKAITADLGIETSIDQNIITDRSMRYQYLCEKRQNLPASLTYQIANRTSTKVWVPKQTVSLDDVFQSLTDLKRFPVLVVFDIFDPKKCLEEMKKFSDCLENNRIFNDVGIYFRLENNEAGKQFNQIIADKQYNCQLTETTQIVGVQSGKIPKFLLKSAWKPMSVISIGNQLRHSKTAVYANCSDLIISYTDNEPIIETRFVWE
ncbi:hypothetical protein UFOVP181_409 [uncultured Caudovirales phage]|uniref:Uncharacterized protein n=1 Tax=uncultured Caudovirales phage TaxID=2100421 RepID=A0A6J7WE39_9CAUD|nr:hypothetical protein UFOVP57_230 [uncultured Caudovirales phage]CAB5209299.1 hypothetical protein UFOVP181_409 [uncultured Caudovirales phage]